MLPLVYVVADIVIRVQVPDKVRTPHCFQVDLIIDLALILGGVHIDMRRMNQIGLINPTLAVLGPGGTWADVLRELPPSKYTLIHGQCKSVGVAGYILGGGVNVVGTSERYGSGASHVERYTMVDAEGRILLVCTSFF